MNDETEEMRRARVDQLHEEATNRLELEERYGKVWSSTELRADFEVVGFMAPLVVVKERKTGKMGSLEFQHMPRFYFNYVPDSE
jgi:hypothetical protein